MASDAKPINDNDRGKQTNLGRTTSGTNQGETSGRFKQETYEKGETMIINSARWMMMIRIQISLSDEQISLYATQKCFDGIPQ